MLKNIAREDQDASDKELRSFLLTKTHCNLDLGCRVSKISPFTREKEPKMHMALVTRFGLENGTLLETFLVFLKGNTTKNIAKNLGGGRAGKRRAHPPVFREFLLKKHSLPLTAGGLVAKDWFRRPAGRPLH